MKRVEPSSKADSSLPLEKLQRAYLDALGKMLTPVELAKALQRQPTVTDAERKLCGEMRIPLGELKQEEVVVPHPGSIGVYFALQTALQRRYKGITESDRRLLRTLHGAPAEPIPGYVNNAILRLSSSIGLIGPTGIGKSTLLTGLADLFPSVIRHENIIKGTETLQLPIIYVSLTGDATIKGLLLRILDAIDRRLGSNVLTNRAARSRATADTLKPIVRDCCVQFGIGVIFVDETQNLTSSRAGGSALVINELLDMRDAMGIPLVFSGTFRMMDLLASDARMKRRLSQNGLHAMAYPTSKDDLYWQQLCDARWAALVVRNPRPMTKGIREALFNTTQGMTWALPIMLVKAQFEAIMSEEEYIDEELIYQVFEERATQMHDLVTAMKDRASSVLEHYEDLYHPAFDAAKADQRRTEFERLGLLGSGKSTKAVKSVEPDARPESAPTSNRRAAKKRRIQSRHSRRRTGNAALRKKAG